MKALLALAAALGALGPLSPAAPAWFRAEPHTELVAAYPAADSLHTAPVSEIRLRFSTAVQLSLSTVTVIGPTGVLRSADSLVHVPGSDERELRQPFGTPLETGEYRVEWRTAGPDGHALRGEYAFAVRYQAPPVASDTAAAPTPGPDQAQLTEVASDAGTGRAADDGRVMGALARWLLYLTMTTALGGFAFRSFVLSRAARAGEDGAFADAVARRMTAAAWVGVASGLVALPLLLGVQAVQTFGGEGLGPSALARVLGSPWGGAFMAQVAGVALLALGLLVGRSRPRWGWLLVGAAGVLIAVGAARGGHAAAGGTLVVAVHALHACAAAVWMGGLLLLVLGVLPAARSRPEALPHTVDAFSRVALVAVGVLVVTGVFNNWDRLGGLGALLTTSFGRTLSLKLVLFGLAAALGFYNWRTVRPMLRAEPRPGLLRVPASLELGLGLAVLAVTALLVALPLP